MLQIQHVQSAHTHNVDVDVAAEIVVAQLQHAQGSAVVERIQSASQPNRNICINKNEQD